MTNKLTARQRSQALGWCSVMGFSAAQLADHFGLTPDEMAAELTTERKNRKGIGKSPEPVPVRHTAGQDAPTHTEALAECVKALQAIVWAGERDINVSHRYKFCIQTARNALSKVGFLP